MGTAAYMAPEQAQGKPLDARADIFSFGSVVYELIAGRRAFPGDSMALVLSSILRDDPAPLGSAAPPGLEPIVMRCLRKHAADRFQEMREVRIALEALWAPTQTVSTQTMQAVAARTEPSIAVLPFANLSADKENEYFSDGLAEEIINALTHVRGLKVTARTSAFAFRGENQDIRKIAETLNVRTILEGSVRRAGSRIRVSAQLINAADGYHLWSERYDAEMADVFAVQDEIAGAIAGALKLKLSAQLANERGHVPPLPAFERFAEGRVFLVRQRDAGGLLEQAQGVYRDRDRPRPGVCTGTRGLGQLLLVAGVQRQVRPASGELMGQARAEAHKALDLEPELPEAMAAIGVGAPP